MKRTLLTTCLLCFGTVAAPAQLIAYFEFNTVDGTTTRSEVGGYSGEINGDAILTSAGQGRPGGDGGANNKALDVSIANPGYVLVDSGEGPENIFNKAAPGDAFTVSLWQKNNSSINSGTFWAESASSSGTSRGASVHIPWSDGTIYFDTGGCCGPDMRLNQNVEAAFPGFDFNVWHHYVFLKNGTHKAIYIDAQLLIEADGYSPMPEDFGLLWIGSGNGGGDPPDAVIDEFAVFSVALSSTQIATLAAGGSPLNFNTDTDGDGISDAWEVANGFNPNDPADAKLDPDGDTLDNLAEYNLGTNPKNADTDADGLNDKVETKSGIWVSLTNTGTSPIKADTDGDGLKDGVENPDLASSTDPNKADTDGDSDNDGTEIALGTNPRDATSNLASLFIPGKPNLLAYWPFDDASNATRTLDTTHQYPGELLDGAGFTSDAGGRSGTAGDRAINFAAADNLTPEHISVTTPTWLNIGAAQDSLTISYWGKNNLDENGLNVNSTSFWTASEGLGSERALAASPWSDGNIYFDTSGCCDRITQRLSGDPGIADWAQWHHFAFIKNGKNMQIWVDGTLVLEGDVDSDFLPLPRSFHSMTIGSFGSANSVNGLMDDFAVFASVLAESDIGQLAQGKKPTDLTGVVIVPPKQLPPPTISISNTATGAQVTYTGTLQSSAAVGGPYADVPGASSPYPVPAGTTAYYRARQ